MVFKIQLTDWTIRVLYFNVYTRQTNQDLICLCVNTSTGEEARGDDWRTELCNIWAGEVHQPLYFYLCKTLLKGMIKFMKPRRMHLLYHKIWKSIFNLYLEGKYI